MVSSTLIGSGHAPRRVIGSVNAAEFFVTVAVATTFFIELGTAHVQHILALMAGGILAAPFGAYVARYLPPRLLMALVGTLIVALATSSSSRCGLSRTIPSPHAHYQAWGEGYAPRVSSHGVRGRSLL